MAEVFAQPSGPRGSLGISTAMPPTLLKVQSAKLSLTLSDGAVYFRPMFSDVVTHSTPVPTCESGALSLPNTHSVVVGESLTSSRSHRMYQQIIMSEALRVPDDVPLTIRQRRAINDALEFASTDTDPVRRLLITVRAFVLHHTTRSYAAELGIRPHSLLDIEARGFDAERSVPSVYGKFIVDWERRAALNPPSASFLMWASRRLRSLVLGKEDNTPLGQLLEWQMRFGSASFWEKTGIDPATISRFRENATMLSFADLIHVGTTLGLLGEGSRSVDSWNSKCVERARRISLRHARSIGRPIASSKLGMMLEWSGVPLTVAGLRQHFPGLKERDAQSIIRYEPIKKSPLALILDSEIVAKNIPGEYREQLRQQMLRAQKHFSRNPSTAKKIAEVVRTRKMSTRYIADVFNAIDPANEKESISKVRSVVFRGAVVDEIPWGHVAAVVARSEREFKGLVSLRAQEISSEYRRRTGQPMSAATLFRKIWGFSPSDQASSVLDGFRGPPHLGVLTRMMDIYLGRSPSDVLTKLHKVRQVNPIRHEAGGGFERLRLLRQGERVPSLPEYQRILEVARIPFGPYHEIGWRDAFGGFLRAGERRSEFGDVQRRILKTLVGEKASTTIEFLNNQSGSSPHDRVHFQARGVGKEVPLSSFKRAMSLMGVEEGDPRALPISLILHEKSFAGALRRWYVDGLIGAEETIRAGMRDLVSSKHPLTHDSIFCVPASPNDILAVKFELEALTAETSRYDAVRRVLLVRSLMRLFPGITIDDIAGGISSVREALHALVTPMDVTRSWKPRFLNAADRKLIEDGLITADNVRRIGLPSMVRSHVRGLVALMGTEVERAQSPMRTLFPPSSQGSYLKVSEVRAAMTNLFAETLHAMNLPPKVAVEVFKAFRGAWSVAHIDFDSARVVGSFLDEWREGSPESLSALEILDAVLKELFSEYRK